MDSFSRDKESVSVECVTLSSHRVTNQRWSYRKWLERKVDLSTWRKEREFFLEGENRRRVWRNRCCCWRNRLLNSEHLPQVENQLSDLDPKGTFGFSRKKKKYADEELLLDSSDDEYTFNTEESEGYRLMDVKNLSTAVSNAHVCEEGEKCFEVYVVLCSRLWHISHIISLTTSFSSLNFTELSIKSLRERLKGIVHIHCKQKIMGKKLQNVYFWLEVFTSLIIKLPDLSYILHLICLSR